MSTSLLYHSFGIRDKGYVYEGTRYEDDSVHFRVARDPSPLLRTLRDFEAAPKS